MLNKKKLRHQNQPLIPLYEHQICSFRPQSDQFPLKIHNQRNQVKRQPKYIFPDSIHKKKIHLLVLQIDTIGVWVSFINSADLCLKKKNTERASLMAKSCYKL